MSGGRPRGISKGLAALAAASLALIGCEGLFTGTRDSTEPLTQLDDGSFAPVKLQLTPEMSPIALNLHGGTIASAIESGRYNSYRATLSLRGVPVATGSFHINNPGAEESDQGGPFRQTMLITSVTQAGEHELTITPSKPKEITIEAPQLEVRRNVQGPAK